MLKKMWMLTGMILLSVLLFIPGCGEATVNEPSYAGGMTDNLLYAINEGDYTMFSRDLDETMMKVIPEAAFQQLKERLKTTIGDYTGEKEASVVQKNNNIYVVVYYTRYTNSDKVKITISFSETGGQVKVAGLYFDAPELR